tara:strand:+ start:1994 stop:2617 length:624 start_codon:yes stop_codon:yes gene_type:complete
MALFDFTIFERNCFVMKNYFYLFLLISFVGFVSSCNKDVSGCMDYTAVNFDPDATISDGSCAYCPDGYEGVGCNDQITPSLLRIDKIVVDQFPAWDGTGGSWDTNGTGADITLELLNSSGSVLYSTSTYYENAIPTTNYPFNSINYSLGSPYENIQIVLYNYDTIFGGYSLMGGVSGQIYSNTNGFPSVVNFDYGGYKFDIHVSYYW